MNETMNETMNDYEMKKYRVGQIIEGEVLRVDDNEVIVDFGYFTEGTMYLNQLTSKTVESAKDVVKVGDRIKAKINKISEEQILLSRLPIESEENFEKVYEDYRARNYVTAKVIEDKNTVLVIKVSGLEGIIFKNEVDVDPEFNASTLVGKEISVKIVELGKDRRTGRTRLVASRKAVQLHALYEQKVENYKQIELEASYEGEVVRIEKYGLLVVANNFQGLVPYREISHLPFKSIEDVVAIGDKVNVKVLEKNDDKKQVLYSIKALLLKPWEVLEQEVNEGDVIEGKIVRITDFGAFINIMPSVDGLLHMSEYSHDPSVKMFEEIKEGQSITVKVLNVDVNRERLSLSVKGLTENPWTSCDLKRFAIVPVKVVGYSEGDAIIEYVEGVVGFLPKNQISSEKRITNASDELTIGQVVDVKVIEFDAESKNLVASIRKIKDDEERKEVKKYMQEQEKDNYKKDTLGDILGDQLREVLKRK